MPEMLKRILAIHAHPDDIEILTGGTVALLAQMGHQVTLATMTSGDCGSRETSPEETARIRRGEAQASAALIGAEYVCGGFEDMSIFNVDAARRRVVELLRATQPDLIITASPIDYHADHEATSVLVRDAAFIAPAPNYRSGSAPPLPEIPHLYFADPIEGRDRDGNAVEPHFVVDITPVFKKKTEMLACHESQRAWLRAHHHMDNYIDSMEQWTQARGQIASVKYGEGYRHYKCHPYPTTPLLEQLLGDRVVTRKQSGKQ
jgi:LmbE family N-acetylglucosaminyl deacetylase